MTAVTEGARRRPKQRSRRVRRRRRILFSLLWLVVAVLVFLGTVAAGLLAAPVDFTPPSPPRPAIIVDRNGKVLGEIANAEQQVEIPASEIPQVMRNAVVAAEDKRFYDSQGVDPVAIVRAAIADLRGQATQGGSTITQQYVKNVFVGDQQSFSRKLKEAALAIRLEQRLSKDEILTRYLNVVYLGQTTYGVEAASEYYFGVHAKELTLSQASMLAGILPAPSSYNPVVNLGLARERQKYVLGRMVESGFVDAATASDAYNAVPAIVKHLPAAVTTGVAPEFVATVSSEVKNKYANDPDTLYRSGLKVTTTLDTNWQQAATAALQQVLPAATDPEAAVVVVDYTTGDLLGIANKTDQGFEQSDPARTAYRTSGSTVKPFTLATALESGYSLDSSVYGPSAKTYSQDQCPNNDPRTGRKKDYTITNDEGGGGSYSLETALAKSVNTVYGPLAITLGTPKVAAVAKAAGLTDAKGTVSTVCSMGLGVTTTPFKEAYAFAALANHGVRNTPRDILTISDGVTSTGTGGQVIARPAASSTTQVVPTGVADDVVTAMRSVVSRGTGTAAQQPNGMDVFGKTGTTDDYTNAWFTGCIPAYSVCITTWMGYRLEKNADGSTHSMRYVEGVGPIFGGTLPAKIFATTADGFRSRATPAPTTSSAPDPTTTRARTRTSAPVVTTSSPPATTPRRTTSSAPPRTTTSAAPTTPTPTVSVTPPAP